MIEINRVYNFECSATFGTLSQERVNKLFTDGRRASGFLELQLEEWFPELTFVDGKGYDHVDPNGVKYDAKCFTRGGAKFCPSVMLGAGRFIDEKKLLVSVIIPVYNYGNQFEKTLSSVFDSTYKNFEIKFCSRSTSSSSSGPTGRSCV
jgi:hypothetical protein